MRTEQSREKQMFDDLKGITEALYRHGHLSDQEAFESQMRRSEAFAKPLLLARSNFDSNSLTPLAPLSPEHIREIRKLVGASQAVLAMHLGVATATLSQWERGTRKPDGPAIRLLSLIERHGLSYVR